MKARAHAFAVAVVEFVKTIDENSQTKRLKDQLIGAVWGIDGNWRAACLARTHKEFASTLCTVVVEADEAEEALKLIFESRISRHGDLNRLRDESTQLRKIFAKASRTANENERLAEEQKRLEKEARKRSRRRR